MELRTEDYMPKYRSLTKKELKEFEKEFVEYLVVNGIDANDWKSIKENESEKAEQIIELFSDVVYDKILDKTSFLINVVNNVLFCFYYGEKSAELILLKYKSDSPLELKDKEEIIKNVQLNPAVFDINLQTKSYPQSRNLELFHMLETGCLIDDGELFNKLKLYLGTRTN